MPYFGIPGVNDHTEGLEYKQPIPIDEYLQDRDSTPVELVDLRSKFFAQKGLKKTVSIPFENGTFFAKPNTSIINPSDEPIISFYPDNTEYNVANARNLQDLEALQQIYTTVGGIGAAMANVKPQAPNWVLQKPGLKVQIPVTQKGMADAKQLSKIIDGVNSLHRFKRIHSYENRPVHIPKEELTPFQKGGPLMTTTGGNLFSDEEIAYSLNTPEFDQTTLDRKGKVNDRDYITEWFKRRRKEDESRELSYKTALNLEKQGFKVSRGDKEKFAGHLYVQKVEQIAKELNAENADEGISYKFTPLDVYRYITREETLHENIIKSVTMLGDIAFPGNMQKVDAKIKQLEEENVLKPGTHDKFLKQLIRFRETSGETTFPQKRIGLDPDGNPITVIDWARLDQVKRSGRYQRQWSKGHIKALARIFSEGLTGADVHTNLFLEPYWSQYIRDPEGVETLIKGNAANADLQDAPLYVQVLLEGKSWDLKDDFLKSVTPDSMFQTHEIEESYLDKDESINLEYQEVAKIMYNKLVSGEGLKNWGIDIDLTKMDKDRNTELLKSYAVAKGVHAYMKAFDRAVGLGERTKDGQRLSVVDLNNWWLSGLWTGKNLKLKAHLDRVLKSTIRKALKQKNVELLEASSPLNSGQIDNIIKDSDFDKDREND